MSDRVSGLSQAKDPRETSIPAACADVTWEMGDGSYDKNLGWWEGGGVGSLVWNPKGGDGHVLIAEVPCEQPMGVGQHPNRRANCGCDGYLGKCDSAVTVCECGEDDSWRDHHYRLLRKAADA